MTLPEEWEKTFYDLYLRTYNVLVAAGCDIAQAEAIAKERVRAAASKMAGVTVESYPRT